MPFAGAWKLQLYRDINYQNIIENRSGSLSQPCKDIATGSSSLHFRTASGIGGFQDCYVVLYQGTGCQGGTTNQVYNSAYFDDDIPVFSARGLKDNVVASYYIGCAI